MKYYLLITNVQNSPIGVPYPVLLVELLYDMNFSYHPKDVASWFGKLLGTFWIFFFRKACNFCGEVCSVG